MSTYVLTVLLIVAIACMLILAFDLDTRLDEWIRRQ